MPDQLTYLSIVRWK